MKFRNTPTKGKLYTACFNLAYDKSNKSSCKTFHMKMSLIYLKMNLSRQNTFSYEWFHTKTCFDTMAQGNLGMAYGEN